MKIKFDLFKILRSVFCCPLVVTCESKRKWKVPKSVKINFQLSLSLSFYSISIPLALKKFKLEEKDVQISNHLFYTNTVQYQITLIAVLCCVQCCHPKLKFFQISKKKIDCSMYHQPNRKLRG